MDDIGRDKGKVGGRFHLAEEFKAGSEILGADIEGVTADNVETGNDSCRPKLGLLQVQLGGILFIKEEVAGVQDYRIGSPLFQVMYKCCLTGQTARGIAFSPTRVQLTVDVSRHDQRGTSRLGFRLCTAAESKPCNHQSSNKCELCLLHVSNLLLFQRRVNTGGLISFCAEIGIVLSSLLLMNQFHRFASWFLEIGSWKLKTEN